MPEIISEQTLMDELNHFRAILTHYDFAEISNVIFFDVESLNCYLKTYADNPFERQYRDIERILNKISPYLPSNISSDTIDALSEILDSSFCNMELLKDHFLFNVKLDFIERVKSIQTESEWQKLLTLCNDLRINQISKQEQTIKANNDGVRTLQYTE
ncbi:MAG: hypothetical protein H7X94_04885 [Vallitaleaceae bacterium]|nr:hypothetical protein [Vallitaleaceae bacterium]